MKWNRTDLAMVLIGLIPALAALLMYKDLPGQMATHITLSEEADRTMGRPWAILMLALLGAGIPLLTKATRGMDPKKDAFANFEGAYGMFRWATTIFICYTGLFLVAYNLGYRFSTKWVSSLGLGLLFMLVGNYLGQVRFNYTFGIKTPWTLADETVWRKTHRLAGPVWMLAGAVIAFTLVIPEIWAYALTIAVLAVAVVLPLVYSYLLFKKTNR